MESLKDYLHTMRSCNLCGQCKWILGPKMRGWRYAEICPIHQRFKFDAYSGQGLINIAQEILEGRLKYEDELIRLIYSCLTCGACDVNCKSIRDMEVMDTILALRAKCVEDGRGPLPEHRAIAQQIEQYHNPFGLPHSLRFDWLPPGTRISANSSIAYFAGCSSAYKHPEIAVNNVNLLNASGMEFKVSGAPDKSTALLRRQNTIWIPLKSAASRPSSPAAPNVSGRFAAVIRASLTWISKSFISLR
jgi:heterodisulfide reductase subunit D